MLNNQEKVKEKKSPTGTMLLLFALLPLSFVSIAIAIPMLSAFSGVQKIRKISEKKAIIYNYKENKELYEKTLVLINKFLSSNDKKTALELSLNELNLMINYHPSLAKIRGAIKFNEIKLTNSLYEIILNADISLPLDEILHEENFYLNKSIDLSLQISKSTLIRDKEILLCLSQIYDANTPLNLEIINIWGEKNLIDLWISLNFSEESQSKIKRMFDNNIQQISYRNNKLIFKNYSINKN